MKRNLLTISIIGIMMFASLAAAIQFFSTIGNGDVEAISVANQLYTAGNYAEAAQIYEQLLSRGVTDSSLYYNLGSTYFVQGDLGRAILNYQRAARLDPRDPDIKANLGIARAQSGYDYSSEPVSPIQSLSEFTSSWLNLNETAVSALLFWFILGFMVLAYRQFQPGKIRSLLRYGMIIAALLFVIAGISFGTRLYVEQTIPEAVIVADVVTLNSDPGEEFSTELQLFSGTEVKLLDTQGNWAHLTGPNDVINGWIPISSIETVSWSSEIGQPTF
jgi:tetratricopeptide (TPR) repeat protein